MKRIGLVLLLCCVFEWCNAQEARKVLLMKVYEVHQDIFNCDPGITIVNPDNTIEKIELTRIKRKEMSNNEENDKIVRGTIEKTINKGYELITSHVLYYTNGIIMTTYIFKSK